MRKINSLFLSTITAMSLVGCGGGGGGSSSTSSGTTTTSTSTATDVTVERGPVYKATVTDANGQVATQKSGTNVYTFATIPVYPITATGGFVDVDGDGQISAGDVELTTVLTSYSSVVTPITTYLGDTSTTEGKAKLAKLKEISGVTSDDDLLKKVPSALSTDVIVLTNALFDIMNDGDTSNDDFISDYDNSAFKTKVTELKTLVSTTTDTKEVMKALEQKVVTNLGLTTLTSDDATTASNATTTATLKVADLKRFVNYSSGNDLYDDDTVADGKVTRTEYNLDTDSGIWSSKDATSYITITADATNPYKLNYVDSKTKEEGTFKIISTKAVDGFTDLFVSKVEIKVTKRATENFDSWTSDHANPYYTDSKTNQNVNITDVNTLKDAYVIGSWTLYFGNSDTYALNADGTISSVKWVVTTSSERVLTPVSGSWKIEGNQIVISIGKETQYMEVKQINGNYYTSDYTIYEVGNIQYDTVYTGSDLDTLIEKINALAPTFTSATSFSVDENQTSAFTAVAKSGAKIVYSLEKGTDADYFNIDSSTGVVTFKTAPDYESGKISYNVYVRATNKLNGLSTTQNVMVLINNIVDEQSTIPEATSFVSGKTIIMNDPNPAGYMTLIFDANGNYEERGFENYLNSNNQPVSYTCYGKWKDLGNNKIAGTCAEGTNYVRPEVIGNVMGDNGEIHLTFSDKTLSVSSNVTVDFKNDNGVQEQITDTIKSVSDISTSSTISVSTGFTESWLNGRTLWTIGNNTVYETTFSGLKQTIVGMNYNQSYTVVNGILKVDETSLNNDITTYEYYKVLVINGEQISVVDGEDLSAVTNGTTATQEFFTTKAAAQAYLSTK